MPGTFQLWNGMFLLSDAGLLAIHPDCCCTEDTAGTTRCCGGSDLSTEVRVTAQGFSNNSCADCSDLDGVYDTDFLSSRTEYDSDVYGDWPTYEWYWLGGTFASSCWAGNLVWLACLQEVHDSTYGSYTCEGGICHNDEPLCHIHSWLTTPEQADTIAGGGGKRITAGYSAPFFHWESLGTGNEILFCQGSQQSLTSESYWSNECFAPGYSPDGVWLEQL